ncbi:hypothetical protein EAVNVH72_02958 [Elizabethkingia anophelis]|nr:hypothetical protein EAVNVH72_01348 [Elizabethkingia anophelis]CAI9685222.1 hypothetical protein EAVNVH72_02958 [Elizabethkingia anophelis]
MLETDLAFPTLKNSRLVYMKIKSQKQIKNVKLLPVSKVFRIFAHLFTEP